MTSTRTYRRGAYRTWSVGEVARLRDLYPDHGVDACCKALPLRSRASILQKAQELRLRTVVAQRGGRFVPNWTDVETQLVHDTAHLSVTQASRVFRRRGFPRSPAALVRRRAKPENNGFYSANALGELIGYSENMVCRWIHRDGLRAVRRGTAAGDRDHWLIAERDFRAFMVANPLALDLRRVPRAAHTWLIDLLARGGVAAEHLPGAA